ncbi:MAG: hypothetical protein MUF68_05030 [Cyclobacteriaceae bacterium]|nr:hypothetical protein [Cyclobacteriaceae bacterium]
MNKNLKKIAFALIASLAFCFSACDDDDDVPNVLVVNDFQSGKFYTIEKTTGTLTEIFTAKLDGTNFTDIRAFVYHKGENKFYASTNRSSGSNLFMVDPETKEAELITENADNNNNTRTVLNGWRSISNLAVSKDDSLFALVYYSVEPSYGGFLKFATDGTPALSAIDAQGGICCGMGMILDEANKEVITANGWDQSNDGTIDIEVFNSETGASKSLTTIETFEGFDEDFSANYIAIRTMVKDNDGKIYGIMYDAYDEFSYFVSIDLANAKILRISTLSENADAQFTGLTYIPENFTK